MFIDSFCDHFPWMFQPSWLISVCMYLYRKCCILHGNGHYLTQQGEKVTLAQRKLNESEKDLTTPLTASSTHAITLWEGDERKLNLNSILSQQILQKPSFTRNDALGKTCVTQKGKCLPFSKIP